MCITQRVFKDNVIKTEAPQKGSPNTYIIKATQRTHPILCEANDGVSTSLHLPLPNPVYLVICAACCRVADLSGAGEYIDKLLKILSIPVSCLRTACYTLVCSFSKKYWLRSNRLLILGTSLSLSFICCHSPVLVTGVFVTVTRI
ncbi:hypothetical protein EDB85DRAFT_1935672 [Lactarius pseudohatsudake]|nr:hypothetical protein EDB85DRAFT_1935672 [Lactarius pseudohatsudake]